MFRIKETNEVWYFDNEKDSAEIDEKKAVGYTKTINGIFICSWGRVTDYKYVKSQTIGDDGK